MWNDIRVIPDEREHVAKYVFTKPDAVAEAVLYRYPDYKTRTVICCSTQAGCPVGCRFCGAGDFFARSLSADEIVSQPVRLLEDVDCSPDEMGRLQIMFMSMGEPLLNLRALDPAIRELHRRYPKAALLISTSAPSIDYAKVERLSREVPTVGLQFSVHETTDEKRNALIPFEAKLSLPGISSAGFSWFRATGRKPFFNYCAHDGNTSNTDATRLECMFPPHIWNATVSVVCERDEGREARNEHQRNLALRFGEKLVERGFDVRVFDPAGQDTIGGGCGQLWFVQDWARRNPDRTQATVGTGKPEVHAPAA